MDANNAGADGFEVFVKQYSNALYNYLKKLTGIGEDAEDLLQEVLIKIAERLPDLRDPARIKTWAFRIATNTAIDFFRKSGKFDQVEFDESLLDGDSANGDIEDELVVDEMNECIRREMGRIAPLYQTALVLYYFEHMTVPEIANICDISVPAVKIRLHRGKRLLNRVLTEGCNFYYDKNSNMRCSSKSKQ
jgi:RNA polymerase sigma factor (sigma-70 family)